MKCNHCEKVLDFRKMRVQNFLETGEVALKVWLVMEEWPKVAGKIMHVRREIREISTDPDIAEGIVDYMNSVYEDKYLKEERPTVRSESAELDHLYAISMQDIFVIRDDTLDEKVVVNSARKWNEEIGDVKIEFPLSDVVVKKIFLKFAENREPFFPSTFVTAFELDREQVRRIVDEFLDMGIIKYEKHNYEIVEDYKTKGEECKNQG